LRLLEAGVRYLPHLLAKDSACLTNTKKNPA
jgi:hypothetical protein